MARWKISGATRAATTWKAWKTRSRSATERRVRLPAEPARTASNSRRSQDASRWRDAKSPSETTGGAGADCSQLASVARPTQRSGEEIPRFTTPGRFVSTATVWTEAAALPPSLQRLAGRTLPARSVHTATAGTEAAALALTTQRAALADPQHRRRFTRRVLEHVPAIHRSRGPVARAAQHGWKTVRVHAVSTGGSGLASTRHRTAAGGSKHQGADGRGKAERVEGKRETNESDVAPQHVVSRQSSARWRSHAGRHDLAVLEDQITIHH